MEAPPPPPPPQFRSGETVFGLDEIHALISCPPETGGSFTALLELPPTQAVELLVKEEDSPAPAFNSAFASRISPECDAIKQEPLDSDRSLKPGKRKGRDKMMNESNKKSSVLDGGELPYVHVRARRGQATDSHSLAERARREKINARMKLLQELVPGCNKISGTASVLDEIINHVQALQRQVEFLSMSLASVNPIIDINLDALLAAQTGLSIDNEYMGLFSPPILPEGQINCSRQPQHEQAIQPHQLEDSFLSYDSSTNSVSLHPSQLKMEL